MIVRLTDSEPYITGVQMGEIRIQCLNEPYNMSAKYALISAKDGNGQLIKSLPVPEGTLSEIQTHGACSAFASNWSPETIQKLRELITAMEKDLLHVHFKEDRDVVRKSQGLGSGEDEEAPQV